MGLATRRRMIVLAASAPLVAGASSRCFANPSFTSGITTGNITNAAVTEASGIAASRLNPNVLWTHDDSGSGAQVYPMTSAGANLGTYTITGASALDWEDIAVGPGPTAGAQYLYIGDIGDNAAFRSSVSVYRVPEPTVSDTQSPTSVNVSGAVRFNFAYPNGPHDAESLFVDPLTRDIYIISKRESTKYVYRAAYPQSTSGTTTMQLVASLPNTIWITAADISPDGDEIIMRGVEQTSALMYVRPAGGSIADAFATTPISIPLLPQSQGEAIGFDPQGHGYYTTTEGASAPVHYFNRLPPPATSVYWDNDGVAAGSRTGSGAGTGGTGTWNASALKWYNGSAEVAWIDGNDAVFWGTVGTVTLAAPRSVNSLSFKTSGYVVGGSTLTMGGSSVTVDGGVTATINSVVAGSAGLTKNGGGTLTLSAANTYSGALNVAAGTLVSVTGFKSGGPMAIASGAEAVVPLSSPAAYNPAAGQYPSGNNVSTSKIASLTIAGSGQLDLGNSDMVIDYDDGTSPLTDIRGMLASGYNGSAWDGPGIISTGALTTDPFTFALGYAENVDLPIPFDNFYGQDADETSVLIKFTWVGDVTLDGVFDFQDLSIFNGNYDAGATTGRVWSEGDLNYDGTIAFQDLSLFNGTYDPSKPSLPEPAGLSGLLAAAMLAGAGVRRRSRGRAAAKIPLDARGVVKYDGK